MYSKTFRTKLAKIIIFTEILVFSITQLGYATVEYVNPYKNINPNNYPGLSFTTPSSQCTLSIPQPLRIKDSVNWGRPLRENLMENIWKQNVFVPQISINGADNKTSEFSKKETERPSQVKQARSREDIQQEKDSLEEQIHGIESGMNKPEVQNNPIIKETMESTLKNARARLAEVNEELKNAPASTASSQTPKREPAQGMTTDDEQKLSAAFLVRDGEDFTSSFPQNLQQIYEQHQDEIDAAIKRQEEYFQQERRSNEMKYKAEQERLQNLAQLDKASEIQEAQRQQESDAMRQEIAAYSQGLLQGMDDYMKKEAAYDPTILKWISVSAEMQRQTKGLADSAIRDDFRARAKIEAINAYIEKHKTELDQKPWLMLKLINMRYAAEVMKNDADKLFWETKLIVWYGAVIDVATFIITSWAKGLAVAKKAAEEAAMQAALNAARKPTAYVVGDKLVTAAGVGAEDAAKQFMGTTGTKAATTAATTGLSTVAGNAAADASAKLTSQQILNMMETMSEKEAADFAKTLTEKQVRDLATTLVEKGAQEGAATIAEQGGQNMAATIAEKGAQQAGTDVAEEAAALATQESLAKMSKGQFINHILNATEKEQMAALVERAQQLGISEKVIQLFKDSPDGAMQLLRVICSKEGLIVIGQEESIQLLQLSTRILKGTATQADHQALQTLISKAEAQGANFWADLAKKGTVTAGGEGFEHIAD